MLLGYVRTFLDWKLAKIPRALPRMRQAVRHSLQPYPKGLKHPKHEVCFVSTLGIGMMTLGRCPVCGYLDS